MRSIYSLLFLSLLVACGADSENQKYLSKRATNNPEHLYSQICAQCHGPKGHGWPADNDDPSGLLKHSPQIAGLPAWYVEDQLIKFQSGVRGAKADDHSGQLMRGIASGLNESQMSGVAQYISNFSVDLVEKSFDPAEQEKINRGRYLYANQCMSCHRYDGRGDVVFRSAPLTGLRREYVRRQLIKYRSGLRGYSEGDLVGQKMIEATRSLTDTEIEELSVYLEALALGDDPRPQRER